MKQAVAAGAFLSVLLLCSCVSIDVEDRIALADQIARRYQFSRIEINTGRFDLTAFIGPPRQSGVLRIYIEGDGFAWVTRRQPSQNPTPIDPVALKLAVRDNRGTAYLARPCQYGTMEPRGCDSRYWTSARFSSEVVDAMDAAITQLKQRAGARSLVLIGYSGGGAVAALVTARRTDVIHLVTVAGNLDPVAWARWHSIPELRASLSPKDRPANLHGVRQTHFVGERDTTVPLEIYRSYRAAFPEDANITLRIVPRADHGCCWERIWPSLLEELQ